MQLTFYILEIIYVVQSPAAIQLVPPNHLHPANQAVQSDYEAAPVFLAQVLISHVPEVELS